MEFVYVVPRAELFRDCYPQGLVPFGASCSREGFERTLSQHGFYVEREHAERTPALKQVIPYSIVVRGAEILLLRRTKRGGEGRLHGKLSIGVGGHINPVDMSEHVAGASRPVPTRRGTQRELDEELRIEGPYEITPVGILNDDSNPVGAVHVGLVQVVSLSGDARVREREVLEGHFASVGELHALVRDGADFETWSRTLVEHIDELLPAAVAADSQLSDA